MDKSKMALTSLILGIVALLWGLLLPGKFIGVLLAIAALVLGVMGLKSGKKTLAIVGIVLAVLAAIWIIILLPILGGVFADVSGALGEY